MEDVPSSPFNDLRETYHAQIRRSSKELQTLERREELKNSLFNQIQSQLSSLPQSLEDYREWREQPLLTLLTFYSSYLSETQLNSVFGVLGEGFKKQTLPLLKLMLCNSKFTDTITHQIIHSLIDLLDNTVKVYDPRDTQQQTLLDDIYLVLSKSYKPSRQKLFLLVTQVINHNTQLTLSKPLIHLYYILRKSFQTIVKEDTLIRLISDALSPYSEDSVQVRVAEIMRVAIEFREYNHPQLLFLFQKVEDVIVSGGYNEDAVRTCFSILYSLIKQSEVNSTIITLLLNSHLLQYIIDQSTLKSTPMDTKQNFVFAISSLCLMCESNELRIVMGTTVSRGIDDTKKETVYCKGREVVTRILVQHLESHNTNVVTICLKAILCCLKSELMGLFMGTDISVKIEKLLSSKNKEIFELSDNINNLLDLN